MKHTDHMMHVRMPKDIREWVERQAADNERSKNAQVVVALRAAMRQQALSEPAAGETAKT